MATSFRDPSLERFRGAVNAWATRTAPAFALPAGAGNERELEIRRGWEREVFRAGYSCLSWPTDLGGRGLGQIEEFVFAEECANVGAPEGLGRVGRLLAGPALFHHGSAEQRATFLPPIVEGTEIWCQGFSEPGAGSDLAAVQTTASRAGERYVVSGQKLWVSFGHYADWCLLLARTGPRESRHRGLSMFILPMRQRGVLVRSVRQISGRSEFVEVFADDAELPAAHRIGEEGEGWAVAMTILGAERGAGFGALALKTIGDDLAVLRHCIGQPQDAGGAGPRLGARLHLLRWQIMRAIEKTAIGEDPLPSSSILKLTWSELSQEVVRRGFESGCPDHEDRWRTRLLEARELTIASGTSEIQRTIVAERVLGLPRDGNARHGR